MVSVTTSERKRGVGHDSKIFGLQSGTLEFTFIAMRKLGDEQVVG